MGDRAVGVEIPMDRARAKGELCQPILARLDANPRAIGNERYPPSRSSGWSRISFKTSPEAALAHRQRNVDGLGDIAQVESRPLADDSRMNRGGSLPSA